MKSKTITDPTQRVFDWDIAHQRMAAIKAELVLENEPPLEALEHVWSEHAKQLAKPLVEDQAGKRVDLVFIRLGDEVYALGADCVYDIRPAEQITPVPHVPDWVCGVYNLRGHILSVIDLSRFLGLPHPDPRDEKPSASSLVVVKTIEMECAFLADQVLAVEVLPAAQLRPPSELVCSLRPEYIHGIVDMNGDEGSFTAILLNVQAILADKRLVVDQEAV